MSAFRVLLYTVCVMLLLVLPGCIQQRIRITRNTHADTQAIRNGFMCDDAFYIVEPRNSEDSSYNELQKREIRRKTEILLENSGYTLVDAPEKADFCIAFTYGNDNETKVHNVPYYIPGSSIMTTGNVLGVQSIQYQEQHTLSGTVVYLPEEHTYYTKSLSLAEYDMQMHRQNVPQVWHGVAYTVNEDPDGRSYFDFLLVHVMAAFGRDSQRPTTHVLYDDDERVDWLRRVYQQPGNIVSPMSDVKQQKRHIQTESVAY